MKSGDFGDIAKAIKLLETLITETGKKNDVQSQFILSHASALTTDLKTLQSHIANYKGDEDYCNRIEKALFWVIEDVVGKKYAVNSELDIGDGRILNMKDYDNDGYTAGSINNLIDDLKSPSKGLKDSKEFK